MFINTFRAGLEMVVRSRASKKSNCVKYVPTSQEIVRLDLLGWVFSTKSVKNESFAIIT